MRTLTAVTLRKLIVFAFVFAFPALAQSGNQVSARYVHIELPGVERTLSLAEVEVYSGIRNLAVRGTAIQSSTLNDASAARAMDGDRSGNYGKRSVSHTLTESYSWWTLDLGSDQAVDRLVIYNRIDCCGGRIAPARVLLIDEQHRVVWEGDIRTIENRYEFELASTMATSKPVTPNLLRNASFRQCTNPGIPDFWDLHHVAALAVEKLHDSYGVDDSIASPEMGTRVLKMVNVEDNFSHFTLMPRKHFARLAEGYYTFSVYLKSDKVGTECRVSPAFGRGNPKVHRLTSTWKRYSTSFPVSGSASDALQPILSFPKKGTYYVAAPQLERGTIATPFQQAIDDDDSPELKKTMLQENTILRKIIDNPPAIRQDSSLSALFEYSYYTEDTVARMRIVSSLDSDVNVRVACVDTENRNSHFAEPKERIIPSRSSIQLDFSVKDLSPGNYVCTVLQTDGQHRIKPVLTELRKLAPNPLEVRINHFRRTLAVNNRSFHIIGMAVGSWRLPPDWYLADLVSHGINTIFCTYPLNTAGTFDASVQVFLESAHRHGLKVVVGIPLSGVKPGNWRERLQAFIRLMHKTVSSSSVIGWWPVDEPLDGSWKDEDFHEIYRSIKEVDPYRLVLVNWSSDSVPSIVGMEPRGTLKATDLYSINYYPFAGIRPDTNIAGFSATTSRMALTSQRNNMVSHSWIQMYGGGDAWREPTGDEISYMVYLNIIFGGMTSYWDTKSNCRSTWERISEINSQIGILSGALFQDEAAQQILPPHISKSFYYTVWKKMSKYYVIVLNSGSKSEILELDTDDFAGSHPQSAESLFDKRKVAMESGYIKEKIKPLESKVYIIENK